MKSLVFFLLVFTFPSIVPAQEESDDMHPTLVEKKHRGQRYDLFDTFPQFNLPNPEVPVFPDSLFNKPLHTTGKDKITKDYSDYFPMPVIRDGDGFSSNMPVAVPDSSVHYFILNKGIVTEPFQHNRK